MATLKGPIYQQYARPPSAPPPTTPPLRAFSPVPSPLSSTPSSPRDHSDWQQKERDRLLWQARWKAYEDRKASRTQAQWSEYEKRKHADTIPRRDDEDITKQATAKRTETDSKRPHSRGPSAEAGEWPSTPSSRSSSVDSRKGTTPFAPTPVRTGSFNYTHSSSQNSRSTTPATPPPRYRASPQPFTQIRPESNGTPPRSPTRSSALPPNYHIFTAPARRMTSSPAPSIPSTPVCPSPLSPNLSIPRAFVQTSSNPIPQNRARSNTNPTSPKPTIFVPKVTALSDGDTSHKADPLDAEERHRRAVDEKRRMEQAAEHATRRSVEAERVRHEERKRLEALGTAQSEAKSARKHEKREAEVLQHQRERTILGQQNRLVQYAWETYEARWKAMQDGQFPPPGQYLSLSDIPWPVVGSIRFVNELEDGRFEGFLLAPGADGVVNAKVLKQRARDAMLRFHPDRFEGRWMHQILESDRAAVKEGVGRVIRFLNELSAKLA
ncbi:hypothetical protein FRC04_006513 [Tulasnella sp. 424]|nr:hypothetical protein FRC04_006513 [Tulasnella sp. 424]KAG8981028.1 hypothetical protein FRC05_003928 [Tulasnella sp. 425]